LAGDAGDLAGEGVQLVDHRVDRVRQLVVFAAQVVGVVVAESVAQYGRRDVGDVADLAGQVAGHRVDRVGQVLPRPADPADVGLAAELALGADLAGDAGHLRREGVELVDHRVDRAGKPLVFALQRLPV